MIRISGVLIPEHKHVVIGLTHIYGVGRIRAQKVLEQCKVEESKKVRELTEAELEKIRSALNQYKLEGELRRSVQIDIKRLIDLGCYRGIRHRRHLPVRGQRTQTNARTRKGKPKPIKA